MSVKENSLQYYIELLRRDRLSGWAWLPESPGEKLKIQVRADNNIVAEAVAGQYRNDLASAGKASGFCAFDIKFIPPITSEALPEIFASGRKMRLPRHVEWEAVTSLAARHASLEGHVDFICPESAHGWVWDPSRPEIRLTVEAVIGDYVLAEGRANRYRADLKNAGKGEGAYGFSLKFDPPIPEDNIPDIRIKDLPQKPILQIGGWSKPTDKVPFSEPAALHSGDLPVVEFHLDHFDGKSVSGWAWYPSEPHLAVAIEIVQGGTVIAKTIADRLRTDLLEAGRETGRYGYSLDFAAEGDLHLRIGGSIELPLNVLQGHMAQARTEPLERRDAYLPVIEGNIDHISREGASGWVWCPSDPQLPLMVEARMHSRVMARTLANQMREDLVPWGKGDGQYGFSLHYDEFLLGDDAPEFRVVLANDRELKAETGLAPLDPTQKLHLRKVGLEDLIADHQRFTQPGPEYEDPDPSLMNALDTSKLPAAPLVFAYYLPQFHAIPVNDHFWGKGFTEWRQITRAMPRFPGHYQPRIPRDLGFYDLTDPAVLPRQAELARAAGVNAFCYYYYWFNGKRVLERPLDAHMGSDVDMPFMIMWANENWTKTWDGCESDVLLRQDYRTEDEDALLADLARHFRDPRYVRLDGRPLFFLYNPKHLPSGVKMINRWRKKLREVHAVNPLIFMAQAFDTIDPRPFGLDGAIEFPPHKLATSHPGRMMPDAYGKGFEGRVIAYDDFVDTSLEEPLPDFPLIKTIVPSWDNDARRPGRGLILEGAAPAKYQAWLKTLLQRAIDHPVFGVPLVAVNAWNEWAEAAYLEPDVHYGGAYLNATARALVSAVNDYVPPHAREKLPDVTVVMPCFNHARFLPERIGSILNQTVLPSEIIFLDDASSDDSVAVARELLKDSAIPWRIEVNKTNSGNVFRQWLKGLSLAKHDLIWIAETDDSADPGFLANILPAFRDEGILGAYGHIRCIEPDGTPRDDLAHYYDGLRCHSWEQSSVTPATKSFAYDFAVRNIVPNASGFVFRRPVVTAAEEARLLQYRFAGDWYFYALLLRGGSLAYCRRAKSWFRVNPQSASRSAFFTDRHLQEHRMVLEDIAKEYGLSNEALDEHAQRLAVYVNRPSMELAQELAPPPCDRRLRICIAAHSFSVGGGEVVPLELANKLKRLGHHVTYLVMERSEEGMASIRQRLRADIPVFYWGDVEHDIPGFLREYGIDVLNSHNVGVDYHLNLLDIELPCACVVSLHGGYETVKDLLNQAFVSYLEREVDCWLSLAEKNCRVLLDAGLAQADFRESFNAVSDVPVEWIDRDKFRRNYQLEDDAFAMMICSRAIEDKGWRTAIKVCQKLNAAQSRSVHLFLIGDGPALNAIQAEYGENPKLHFLGHLEEPMRYFRSFDMAIFPSTYVGETFPLFLVECLAAGLPIVSSDIGEIPRILGPEKIRAGHLVSFRQPPETMAEAMSGPILMYLRSPAAFAAVRRNAEMRAERFSMGRLAEFYLSIFNEKIAYIRQQAYAGGEKQGVLEDVQ